MTLQTRIINPLPFSLDSQDAVRFTKECKDECLYGQVIRNDRLPAFYFTRDDMALNPITSLWVECLDGTDQQFIPLTTVGNIISAEDASEQATIEGGPPAPGDSYLILTDNTGAGNEWADNVGSIATWNGASWDYLVPTACDETTDDEGDIWRYIEGVWINTGPTKFHQLFVGDKNYFVWYCCPLIDLILNCGYKRIVATDGTNTWYSEPVLVTDFASAPCEFIEAKWRNNCSLGDFPYNAYPQFYWCHVLADEKALGIPTTPEESEVEVDNLGSEKVVWLKQRKTWNIQPGDPVPGYLADAYRSWKLHDDVQIKLPGQTEFFCVERSTLDVEQPAWDDYGCYADMSINFNYEADVISKGCCDNLLFKDCDYYNNRCILGDKNVIRRAGESERPAIELLPPAVDDCYIIIADAGSDPQWSSHINEIACWNGSGWDYTPIPDLSYVCTSEEGKIMKDGFIVLEWGAVFSTAQTPNSITVIVLYLGDECTFLDLRYRENLIPTPGPWIVFDTWSDTVDEIPAINLHVRTITITGLNPITEYQISVRVYNQNCKEINIGNTLLETTT